MSGGHTPGPWTKGRGPSRCQVYDAKGRIVGFAREHPAPDDVGRIDGTEAEANARLIAAAPELLVVAQMAEAVLTSLDHTTYIEPGALRALRDAIAKAAGQ